MLSRVLPTQGAPSGQASVISKIKNSQKSGLRVLKQVMNLSLINIFKTPGQYPISLGKETYFLLKMFRFCLKNS
jgi:type IV secretory pathway TraG/TraD family ATPase VirD4